MSEDNTEIRKLRAEYKAAKEDLKASKAMEDEIRLEVQRDINLMKELKAAGHPEGIADEVAKHLSADMPVNSTTVRTALSRVGYDASFDQAAQPAQRVDEALPPPAAPPKGGLAEDLASMAKTGHPASLATEIGQAKDQAELTAIMARHGLKTDGTTLNG